MTQAPRYRPGPDVMWREVGGEVVLCAPEEGFYFVLNPTGSCVWTELSAGRSPGDAEQALTRRFDVDPETARRDVDTLLGQLLEASLLAPNPEAAAG